MQIEHKTEKGIVLFVKLTEDVISLTEVIKKSLWYRHEVGFSYINLPSEGFNLVGLTSEITEDEAKIMVPLIKRVYGQSYYDYSVKFHVGYGYVGTALESFKSIMKIKDIYETNPYGAKQPLIDNDYTNHELRDGWSKKQSKTGKWIVLFKPND